MTTSPFPKSLSTVIVDGVTICTVAGWDGRLEIVPRDKLAAYVRAEHRDRPALYLTVSRDAQAGTYIGSGIVDERLTAHLTDPSKEEFEYAIIVYAPSGWLHTSRCGWLEAHVYRKVKGVGQVRLLNKVPPTLPRLSDLEEMALRFYLDMVVSILARTHFSVLVERIPAIYTPLAPTAESPDATTYKLAASYAAFMIERPDGLFVAPGSMGRVRVGKRWAAKKGTGFKRREALIADGTLQPLAGGEFYVVVREFRVRSASEASCILSTQENSGQTAWRHINTGVPYREHTEQDRAA